jgi:hypothetical protein
MKGTMFDDKVRIGQPRFKGTEPISGLLQKHTTGQSWPKIKNSIRQAFKKKTAVSEPIFSEGGQFEDASGVLKERHARPKLKRGTKWKRKEKKIKTPELPTPKLSVVEPPHRALFEGNDSFSPTEGVSDQNSFHQGSPRVLSSPEISSKSSLEISSEFDPQDITVTPYKTPYRRKKGRKHHTIDPDCIAVRRTRRVKKPYVRYTPD